MIRVLGIDPGSLLTGYAVVTAQGRPVRLGYVECGVIRAGRGEPMEKRLAEIARNVGEIIEEHRPDIVAVEDVFHAAHARSALALGQARGAILAAAGLARIPVCAYPPALVKKTVTGRGRAPKGQVALMVQRLLGLRRTPAADAADALAVAVTHAQIGAARRRFP